MESINTSARRLLRGLSNHARRNPENWFANVSDLRGEPESRDPEADKALLLALQYSEDKGWIAYQNAHLEVRITAAGMDELNRAPDPKAP